MTTKKERQIIKKVDVYGLAHNLVTKMETRMNNIELRFGVIRKWIEAPKQDKMPKEEVLKHLNESLDEIKFIMDSSKTISQTHISIIKEFMTDISKKYHPENQQELRDHEK